MNKICIRNIYTEFLESYVEDDHNTFVESQALKHSCEIDDIENLIEI